MRLVAIVLKDRCYGQGKETFASALQVQDSRKVFSVRAMPSRMHTYKVPRRKDKRAVEVNSATFRVPQC